MKDNYEDRFHRAKNRLQEERARRKSREIRRHPDDENQESEGGLDDSSSFCSAVSKASKTSYSSEFSRNTSKRDTKGPRSEWRNKAMAVIERSKSNWKEESELLRDTDASSLHSGRSSGLKDHEDEIDSLVERNARLNERESFLNVESDFLDAAEAAEQRKRADSYLGKHIEENGDEDESLDSHHSVTTTRTTASSRARRIREDEASDLNRSFHQAKALWQVRCKDEHTPLAMDDPTPIKSNSHYQTTRAQQYKPEKAEDESIEINSHNPAEDDMENFPASPSDSVKSAKSTRSSKSGMSSKSIKSSKSEQLFGIRGKLMRSNSSSKESGSPKSVKSEYIRHTPMDDGDASTAVAEEKFPKRNQVESAHPVVDTTFLATLGQKHENEDVLGESSKSNIPQKRTTSSYRQARDPMKSFMNTNPVEDVVSTLHASPKESYDIQSSSSISSSRSKYSYQSKKRDNHQPRDEEEENGDSSSKTSTSQKESFHGQSCSPVSSTGDNHSYQSKKKQEESTSTDSYRMTTSASVSSNKSNKSHRSNRSKYSYHSSKRQESLDLERSVDEFESMLPEELSIPMIIQDLENGENEPPMQPRELSYREKSALLASMENTTTESGTDENGPSARYRFRQLGQTAKKNDFQSKLGVVENTAGARSKTSAVLPEALKEQKNLYNTKTSSKNNAALPKKTTQQENDSIELTNFVKENRELKARLEKERTRRSDLDDKAAKLQLEVHQQGEEIQRLKRRKDASASHKEQLYKLEDALQQTNRHLVGVVDENVQLREDLEEERARRCKAENQAQHYQSKLKKRSDEVVAVAREMKRKEETYQRLLLEERHLREVAESQLAEACHHINTTEQERDDDFDELEAQNLELRHTVKRMENYLKQKFGEQQQKVPQSSSSTNKTRHVRRQSGGSEVGIHLSSKPSMISEMTTDYDFDELNHSQEGEI